VGVASGEEDADGDGGFETEGASDPLSDAVKDGESDGVDEPQRDGDGVPVPQGDPVVDGVKESEAVTLCVEDGEKEAEVQPDAVSVPGVGRASVVDGEGEGEVVGV